MAKDIYHSLVKNALINEGWTITHDPYILPLGLGFRKVAADLGAEKCIAAEKSDNSTGSLTKILVEIKSFISASNFNELHHSVGQIDFYTLLLEEYEPERMPYLAIPKDAYNDLMREPIIQVFLNRHNIHLIIFDTNQATIFQWKK